MRYLIALLVTFQAATAHADNYPGVCVSNCHIPTSTSYSGYSPEGGPSIAWGGMLGRANQNIRNCGPNFVCATGTAIVGYSLGIIFDGPYYAIKGVGYGLLYGVKGLGFVGKKIGQGIAYPFKSRPTPPPASWEAYKHQILKMQKRLAKKDKTLRPNYVWCKGNVPLSHGPSRLQWESRCNPGDAITRAYLPETVKHSNAGEMTPMGLPADVVATAAATASGSDAASNEVLAKTEALASAAAPADAVPAAAPASVDTTAPVPTSIPPAPSESPSDIAAPTSQVAPVPDAAATPSGTSPGIPTALPTSAQPVLRDPASALKGTQESTSDAGKGGFDSREPMLGAKGQEVLKDYQATAKQSPDLDYETAIAATGRTEPTNPSFGASNVPAAGAAPPAASKAATPPDISPPSGMPPVALHPLVASGTASLIGNPDRYRFSFVRQNGATCVPVMARQFLADEGILKSEDELYYKVLEKRWWATPALCTHDRTPQSLCNLIYDPTTKQCRLTSDDNTKSGQPSAVICSVARKEGATFTVGISALLNEYSKRTYAQAIFSPPPQTTRAELSKLQTAELDVARKELLDALRNGRNVGIGMLGGTLWNSPSKELHVVAVSAAVELPNGTILGYYVNDGAGSYGRYVPVAVFEKAWIDDTLFRIYSK